MPRHVCTLEAVHRCYTWVHLTWIKQESRAVAVKPRDVAVVVQDDGHPGFDRTGNSAIRSADPENHTLEQNMKLIGWPVAEIWPFEIRHITRGAFGTPRFEGRGVRRGSSIATLKRAMIVSYTLPLWPIALFLTIRLQFSVECLRRSIQRGSLGSKF